MQIEGCDCSEFERREGYIPCESLIAGQVSSLKGKPMIADLFEMDQREYIVIKNEEADIKTVIEMAWKNQRPQMMGFLMVLVASIVGVVVGAYFSDALCLGSVVVGIGSFVGLLMSIPSSKAQDNKIVDIDDNRLARLRNKVEVIEAKIAAGNEFKEELRAAKDFFKTKYDLYLGLKHRPLTCVNQNTVIYKR